MKQADLRKFQRQELTIEFANGRSLTAPLAHWVGALLDTIGQEKLNQVVEKIQAYQGKPPVHRARLILPPSLRAEQAVANGDV